jgi:outer membrane protein assembly factor BamB
MGAAHAQGPGRGGGDWITDGGDAQRSSWVRTDPKISVPKLREPGFALIWKIKLGSEPGVASTLDRYIGYRGFRSLAFLGSAAGELTAIDTDLGRIEWQKKLTGSAAQAPGACTGGMTSDLARATYAGFPLSAFAGRGGTGGRGGAKSAVGEPGEGAVTLVATVQNAAPRGGSAPTPAPPAAGARGAAPPLSGSFGRLSPYLGVVSSDGMYHELYVSNGEEPMPPVAFLPPNADVRQLTILGNTAYAATAQGCGGAPNGVWSLDLSSKEVSHWTTTSDIAGGGFAFGGDSTLFAATTGGDLVSLDPESLQVKNTYRADNQSFRSFPVVFEYQTKTLVAIATRDGHMHLVDAASLTGASYAATATGPLASWQDASGTRWIVAPSKNSIEAWKVVGEGDAPALERGWTSAEMASPLAPMIVDGVVFAVSNSPTAVLHALDGATGKELWNSGTTMSAAVRISGLSGSASQLYLGTSDGTIYAFGFPIEH